MVKNITRTLTVYDVIFGTITLDSDRTPTINNATVITTPYKTGNRLATFVAEANGVTAPYLACQSREVTYTMPTDQYLELAEEIKKGSVNMAKLITRTITVYGYVFAKFDENDVMTDRKVVESTEKMGQKKLKAYADENGLSEYTCIRTSEDERVYGMDLEVFLANAKEIKDAEEQ